MCSSKARGHGRLVLWKRRICWNHFRQRTRVEEKVREGKVVGRYKKHRWEQRARHQVWHEHLTGWNFARLVRVTQYKHGIHISSCIAVQLDQKKSSRLTSLIIFSKKKTPVASRIARANERKSTAERFLGKRFQASKILSGLPSKARYKIRFLADNLQASKNELEVNRSSMNPLLRIWIQNGIISCLRQPSYETFGALHEPKAGNNLFHDWGRDCRLALYHFS